MPPNRRTTDAVLDSARSRVVRGTDRFAKARAVRADNIEARRNSPSAPRYVEPPTCSAAELYRAEKAAGMARQQPKIDEARQALDRYLADLQAHQKGGRPRKEKT